MNKTRAEHLPIEKLRPFEGHPFKVADNEEMDQLVESIMALPAVRFVVEEILGRDATITGRTDIYRLYLNNMQDSWLWGYGFGNGNYAAVRSAQSDLCERFTVRFLYLISVFFSIFLK